MKGNIRLSYVLTTYNKLTYLREVIKELIANCTADDEIIVTDGGSSDGTKEYLQKLYDEGKIHQFVSEKDFGESHGFNKGLLIAQGELIKLLTDDDVFYYPAIQACKNFMLENQQIEVLNTNGGWGDVSNLDVLEFTQIYEDFFINRWIKNGHPFAHCALGLMLRKDSIAKMGLLGVGFCRADAEYTLRFTGAQVNFYWYSGVSYVRILNSQSNSVKMKSVIDKETERLNRYYGFDIDKIYYNNSEEKSDTTGSNSRLNKIKKGLHFIRDTISGTKNRDINLEVCESDPQPSTQELDFKEVYNNGLEWLELVNKRVNRFIGPGAQS